MVVMNDNKHKTIKCIDFINATYQGFIDQNDHFCGFGVLIDDQFNYYLSNWKNNYFHGHTLIKFYNQLILYGQWDQYTMKGYQIIIKENLYIYTYSAQNSSELWESQILAFDKSKDIIYHIQYKKENEYKFIIKSRKKLRPISQQILLHINKKIPIYLLTFGHYLDNLITFQNEIYAQPYQDNQFFFFLGIKRAFKQKKIGIVMHADSFKTISIGVYNQKGNLNGIGLSNNYHGVIIGIFKDNLLIKDSHPQAYQVYKTNKNNQEYLNSIKIKKLLKQKHYKSIQFIHHFIFFSKLIKIKEFIRALCTQIQSFQLQSKIKGQSKCSSSKQCDEQSKDNLCQDKYFMMNQDKISLQQQKNHEKLNDQRNLYKRPGFIWKRQNQISRTPSPQFSPINNAKLIQKKQLKSDQMKNLQTVLRKNQNKKSNGINLWPEKH